jgi:hypothetical protein
VRKAIGPPLFIVRVTDDQLQEFNRSPIQAQLLRGSSKKFGPHRDIVLVREIASKTRQNLRRWRRLKGGGVIFKFFGVPYFRYSNSKHFANISTVWVNVMARKLLIKHFSGVGKAFSLSFVCFLARS